MFLPPKPNNAPMFQQPMAGMPDAALGPDAQRKKLLAKMLMDQPVQQNDGTAFGGMAQAFAMGARGYANGAAMNPRNFDQGMGSWAPTITRG